MLAPVVQRNLHPILIIPRQKYGVTPLFREKGFYFTLLIVFLSLLLLARLFVFLLLGLLRLPSLLPLLPLLRSRGGVAALRGLRLLPRGWL